MALQAFQSCFNVADNHCDVLLHLRLNSPATPGNTAPASALQPVGQAKRGPRWRLEQTDSDKAEETTMPPNALDVATYSLHAVVLSVASAYFKARLSSPWQAISCSSSEGPGGSSTRPANIRYELVEHVEADEVEAMEKVLRLMYGFPIPAKSSIHLLFQCVRLADRLEAVQSLKAPLAQLTAAVKEGTEAADWAFAAQVYSMPPGAASLPDATLLKDAGRDLLKRLYCNVPAVIASQQLMQEFRSLPLPAVLAWAGLDELEVCSENCVACLLTAWVAGQPAGAVSTEQLEQLAHQVRVLHLGQTYQYHILPNLPWFKGCSSMRHLPSLLTCKGVTSTGQGVFPRPGLTGLIDWQGAPLWVAAPRKRCSTGAAGHLTWLVGAAELQQLYATGSVLCPYHRVVNGIPLTFSMEAYSDTAAQPGKSVGLFCHVAEDAGCGLGLPWSNAAVVTVGSCTFKVTGPDAARSKEVTHTRCVLRGTSGGGLPAFFKPPAPSAVATSQPAPAAVATFEQLMAPYLKDGQLHLEATFKADDTFGS